MDEISIARLKELSVKVEGWVNRYDIDKSFYEDLYDAQISVRSHIVAHENTYKSPHEYDAMLCLSSYIIVCLLSRINEINETI